MVTPPPKNGGFNADVLAAAYIAGVDRVYLCGGAQAVGALAYGTASIPKVDKIVGPGNIFVATAKRLTYGQVDIDMIAGPSEILILADETADPAYLAADLMSQAEHDVLASAILLTDSEEIANRTLEELEKQVVTLSREKIIRQSLRDYGAVIVCRDMDEAVAFANRLAPEFSGNIPRSLWGIIMPALITCLQPAVPPGFSPRYRWTALLRNPALFTITGRLWSGIRMILCPLPTLRGWMPMRILSRYGLNKRHMEREP